MVGFTALIAAADKGHASVVTLLLADKRVDPGVADPSGRVRILGSDLPSKSAKQRKKTRGN